MPDVYDVARREPAEMVCRDCGALFAEYWLDEVYHEENQCPSCGSDRIKRAEDTRPEPLIRMLEWMGEQAGDS